MTDPRLSGAIRPQAEHPFWHIPGSMSEAFAKLHLESRALIDEMTRALPDWLYRLITGDER